MAKSSAHMQKMSGGSASHIDRTEMNEPEYLLPKQFRKKNEINMTAAEAQKIEKFLYEEAKENYQNKFGQKLQSKNFMQEIVLNLNKNHTMQDLEKWKKAFEKETGFKVIMMGIHRDEGHVKKDKNGKEFAIYNYHAHITCFTLDQTTGQQLYRKAVTAKQKKESPQLKPFNRERMQRIQTLTAHSLKMERGVKGSKKQRLGHKEYRAYVQEKEKIQIEMQELRAELGEYKTENGNLKKALADKTQELEEHKQKSQKQEKVLMARIKDVNELNTQLRAELKEAKADRTAYAELEQTIKDLKNQVRDKKITRKEVLDFKIGTEDGTMTVAQRITQLKAIVRAQEKEIKELKEPKQPKPQIKIRLSDLYHGINFGDIEIKIDKKRISWDKDLNFIRVDGRFMDGIELINKYAKDPKLTLEKVKIEEKAPKHQTKTHKIGYER